jgi:hypothetical protein
MQNLWAWPHTCHHSLEGGLALVCSLWVGDVSVSLWMHSGFPTGASLALPGCSVVSGRHVYVSRSQVWFAFQPEVIFLFLLLLESSSCTNVKTEDEAS